MLRNLPCTKRSLSYSKWILRKSYNHNYSPILPIYNPMYSVMFCNFILAVNHSIVQQSSFYMFFLSQLYVVNPPRL